MQSSFKQNTTVTRKHRIELTADDIVALLKQKLSDVPDRVSVYFQVPGGGDWSNTAINIDSEDPIVVTWEAVEEEEASALKVGQAVRHGSHRAVIQSFERDRRVVTIKFDDTGSTSAVLTSELQPVSIKKTDGVEGKNFID